MTADAGGAPGTRDETPERIRGAGRVVLIGAALGVAGQLLFFDVGLGVNFPIAILLLLAGGWVTRRPGVRPSAADAWLGPAAVAFAGFAAVRADATLVRLDVLTALGLSGAALATFGGREIVRRPLSAVLQAGFTVAGWVGGGAVAAALDARRALPPRRRTADRARPFVPVLRGLLIAAPVLVVFVTLFASADPIFARTVEDLVGLDLDLGDVTGRLVLTAAIAWLATGAVAMAASRPPAVIEDVAHASTAWRLGTTEAVTVLVLVNAVFAGFVALQAAYLFGGLDTMQAIGLSYAEYARRGFFELVAVAVLAVGLVIAIDRLARTRPSRLIGSGVALMVLTGAVLVSSAHRMRLYQEAYGWTELRLYVLATIAILAVVLIGMVTGLLVDRVRWIGHVAIIAGLVVGIGLNVIGPVRFITEQNVARLADPSHVPGHGSAGLDELYLASLEDDAVPGLVRALPLLDDERADYLRFDLGLRLRQLREPGLEAWQAWNLGRERAREALESADLTSP
jgi:F0F1-type ATP synthase assembly protein I